MTIAVTCSCGGQFAAPPHLAGKTVRCPKCQQPLQVPGPPTAPLAPLAPIVNPFSEQAAPVTAELVPPVAPVAPTKPISQDPFGGKATVGGPAVGQPYPQVAPTYQQQPTYGQPPTAQYAQDYGHSRRKSYTAYYILGAVLFVFVGFVFVAGIGIYQIVQDLEDFSYEDSPSLPVQMEDYAAARKRFKTKLVIRGESPQEWDPLETPNGAEELIYGSDRHVLRAYVDPPPADGRPRPGVVFLHGGFAWGEGDWEMSQPYRDQGFVVMSPVLRGENGQSGDFSLYYDEVDDVLAATDAFAELPYVDETQLYISGHSAGGTLAALTAMASDRFQAMASFSGSMNVEGMSAWDPGLVVYNESITAETLMRSPEAYARSFKCPAQLYFGSEEAWFPEQTSRTAATAQSAGLNVQAIMVPGDHMSSVRPAMMGSIGFFREIGLSKGNLPPNMGESAPPTVAPPVTPPDFKPRDFSIPELPDRPQASTPDPAPPTDNQAFIPEPDGSTRFIPSGDGSFSIPGRPNIPTPPRPPLPRGLTSRHQGVVTFEVLDYTGRLPQRFSAHRALIRLPWADIGRLQIDEEAGAISVPVRRGLSLSTAAAKQAMEAQGFTIGSTTFKSNDAEDKSKEDESKAANGES